MSKKRKNTVRPTPADQPSEFKTTLRQLAEQRRGGSVNITGLEFRFLVSALMILELPEDPNHFVRLEGVEDIDMIMTDGNEFIQTKTSKNKIDASGFLMLNVLQHFLTVHEIDPTARFKVIHNTSFAKGNMSVLTDQNFTSDGLTYWREQLPSIKNNEQMENFASLISFERSDADSLEKSIITTLLSRYGINIGAEQPFVRALFYNIFQWSKRRETISRSDILKLFQSVRDSFANFPENQAIKYKWVNAVSYNTSANDQGFFEGKAARPSDVASGFPVQRPEWETKIAESLQTFDVTLVKSSSGQGKSTLAWTAGLAAKGDSYLIYQLSRCSSQKEAIGVIEFLEARLIIGEFPLVIVDGLGSAHSFWHILAEEFRGKPVRFILTAREEDWTRYGNDVSKFSLNVIDIRMSIKEAKEIFLELKRRDKLHKTVQTWESIWEQVSHKGLLIEYVFLLTQGQMIEERLTQQVKTLGQDRDSGAKIEILRLVSLADVLNIRLHTSKVMGRVYEVTHFSSDRNELLHQLEKEYYLKFGEQYIEGLHPVRSKHLVDILHSNISAEDSLLALLKIIDEDSVYDFFISAPHYFGLSDRFFNEVARIIARKSLSEMVAVIDGLMHTEPLYYWLTNRETFDEASKIGGFFIFVSSTVPVNGQGIFENLVNSLGENAGGLRIYAELLRKLTPYSFQNSSIQRFVEKLHDELKKLPPSQNVNGASFLQRWFHVFHLDIPNLVDLSDNVVLETIRNKSLKESTELVSYYFAVDPARYRNFVAANRAELIAVLKKYTDTPTIEIIDNEVRSTYLLEQELKDINGQSVQRVETFRTFFPEQELYCTSGDILPFPSEEIVFYAKQSATKNIPPENLADDFNVHINKIWNKVILEKYGAQSSYQWQKCHLEIRNLIVQLARKCRKLLECVLENKGPKALSLNKEFVDDGNEYFRTSKIAFTFPSQSMRYNVKTFEKEDQEIRSYYTSFSNFVNQFLDFVSPKGESHQRLALINLKSAVKILPNVQSAFGSVEQATSSYFDTSELKEKELTVLQRLIETCQFYLHWFNSPAREKVVVAERSVQTWLRQFQHAEIDSIKSVLSTLALSIGFEFTLPLRVLEDENLKYATIGVQNCNLENEADSISLFMGLVDLDKTDINFFILVFADENKLIKGAIRIGERFLAKVRDLVQGIVSEDQMAIPLPIELTDPTVLLPIGFVTASPGTLVTAPYFKMMFNIWKLNEYRSRIDSRNPTEKNWLGTLEKSHADSIKGDLGISIEGGLALHQQQFVFDFLDGRIQPDAQTIVDLMLEQAKAIQQK